MSNPDKDMVLVEYGELFELYSTLADATEAAATGDPNLVSKNAAAAKRMVLDLHEDAEENGRKLQHVGVGNGDYQIKTSQR